MLFEQIVPDSGVVSIGRTPAPIQFTMHLRVRGISYCVFAVGAGIRGFH